MEDSKQDLLLKLTNNEELAKIKDICYSLGNQERLQIIKLLIKKPLIVSDIAKELMLPISTVARHIDILIESNIVSFSFQSCIKGHSKLCVLNISSLQLLLLDENDANKKQEIIESLGVGLFSECNIEKPCGMLGKDNELIEKNLPRLFYDPKRTKAELIYFNAGYLTYNFSNPLSSMKDAKQIEFSFETCSEAPYYNMNWPSDLTISVNNQELLTHTLPSDFGGRRGKYTPAYWSLSNTQFGTLLNVKINTDGLFLNNELIDSKIKILSLFSGNEKFIPLKLEIKENAINKRGINLFGSNFGDFNQAIVMKITK